jgi:integrase
MPVENRGTKKNPRWRYAFTIRRRRYREAIPEAHTKYEAEQAEIEAKKAVFEGRYGRATGEADFMDFIHKVFLPWSKQNKRRWYDDELWAVAIEPWFKGKTFAEISPLAVEKFKMDRSNSITKRGTTRKPGSVNRDLEILSRVFSLAIDFGVTAENPCRKVRRLRMDNERRRYLLDEEEAALLPQLAVATRAPLTDLVTVALGTGMRRGDQFGLRVSKVDFQRNSIWVPNSKTGRDYAIPMNADVRAVMERHCPGKRPDDYVFANPRTRTPYIDLKRAFKKACTGAGIVDLHWHDLRHTFGTRLAEAGYSEATIAELMGHSNPKTTRRYTHATVRSLRSAVEAVRRPGGRVCPIFAPRAEEAARALGSK